MKRRNLTPEVNYRSKTLTNQCIKNCINYICNLDDEKLLSMRYVIPFYSTKNSITEIKIIDSREQSIIKSKKVLSLQSEEVVIFQDDLGNYIQLESYGSESLILRFIISQEISDSYERIKFLFNSVESFLKVSNYYVPPLYIRLTDKVDFGFKEERNFENKLNFFVSELGFTNLLNDNESCLLVRTRHFNPIKDLNFPVKFCDNDNFTQDKNSNKNCQLINDVEEEG